MIYEIKPLVFEDVELKKQISKISNPADDPSPLQYFDDSFPFQIAPLDSMTQFEPLESATPLHPVLPLLKRVLKRLQT